MKSPLVGKQSKRNFIRGEGSICLYGESTGVQIANLGGPIDRWGVVFALLDQGLIFSERFRQEIFSRGGLSNA
jgi:hypothetical protein